MQYIECLKFCFYRFLYQSRFVVSLMASGYNEHVVDFVDLSTLYVDQFLCPLLLIWLNFNLSMDK